MPFSGSGKNRRFTDQETIPPVSDGFFFVVITEKPSSWYYYACMHGASNIACPVCHKNQTANVPDDWMRNYKAPPFLPGGIG